MNKKGKWKYSTLWFLHPELNWQCAKTKSDFNKNKSIMLAAEKRISHWFGNQYLNTEVKKISVFSKR